MITVDLDTIRHIVGDVGIEETGLPPLSHPKGNNQVHACVLLGDGRVYEMVKTYYNQNLWNYVYYVHSEGEVHGRV